MSAIDVNRALAYLTRTPRVLALLKGLRCALHPGEDAMKAYAIWVVIVGASGILGGVEGALTHTSLLRVAFDIVGGVIGNAVVIYAVAPLLWRTP